MSVTSRLKFSVPSPHHLLISLLIAGLGWLSGQALSRIDQAIYGHPATVVESLENLKRFADQQFQRKLKEVQHG